MRTPLGAAVIGVAVLGIAGLVGLMAWGLSHKTPVTSLSGITRVHQPAPDFTLPLFDGGELVLSDFIGRPIVLNFWASWCAPCREEAIGLERAWRNYKNDDVLFVGLDIQDSEESARAYLQEFGVTYPSGRDVDGKITVDYGVIGIPVTFFVNREGAIERRWVGALDEGQLLAWVDELTSGATPSGELEGTNLEGFFRLDQQR